MMRHDQFAEMLRSVEISEGMVSTCSDHYGLQWQRVGSVC